MSRGSVQATLTDSSGNSQPALVVYGSESQMNIQVPGNAAAGLASLLVNNGVANSPPLALEIGLAPPVIVGIALAPTQPAGSSNPATTLLNVQVTGLDPTVLGNLSRLVVTVDGASVPVTQVQSQGGGLYLIQVQLTQQAPGSVAVWVDGSSWPPVPISVFGLSPIQWAFAGGLPGSSESC
jgi:hypothetical protein